MRVVFLTGRGSQSYSVTRNWLNKYGFGCCALFMRKDKDHRADSVVKSELLDKVARSYDEPDLILDDRNSVVDMWRERGYRCIQVAEGDF